VDMVFGPDNLFKLPEMIERVQNGERVLMTKWQPHERRVQNFIPEEWVEKGHVEGCKAYISITKGCDNFCTFCVVPYTRGRERSRTIESVVTETERLAADGFKQVTLLGQNVNSYRSAGADFADLMVAVASVDGIERVRFTSPHPKDFPEKFLHVMAEHPNICNHIHLPLQAGNNRVLDLMARTYTKESFLDLVDNVRTTVPGVALTTDVIVGFPTETDEEFEDTMEVLEQVEFDSAYIFKYSERKNTIAYKKHPDDVTPAKKTERIVRVFALQKQKSLKRNREDIGKRLQVLIEGPSKKNPDEWMGRTDSNKIVVLAKRDFDKGDMVLAEITGATANTLFGHEIEN